MKKLKKEIETYNEIKLTLSLRWFDKNYLKKSYSLIIIITFIMNIRNKTLKGLNIDDKFCHIQIYKEFRSNLQCTKCMQFGNYSATCNLLKKCMICDFEHDTKMHICKNCNLKTICSHTILNCANCEDDYQINDFTCEIIKTLILKIIEIDEFKL